MHILYLYHKPLVPHFGGVEKVSAILTKEFRKLGHRVSFLYISNPSTSSKSQLSPAYFIEPKDDARSEKFKKLIQEEKIDIIINQSFTIEMAHFLESLKEISVPLVSVHHNQPFSYYGKERLYKKLDRPVTFSGNLTKFIAWISPLLFRYVFNIILKREFRGVLKISKKIFLLSDKFIPRILKIMPETNPISLRSINNPNTFNIKTIENGEKEKLIIFVGRLEDPQKNVKAFIDVWNKFHISHADWKALVIGEGNYRKSFEEYAKKNGTKNLKFIGNKQDVTPYYSKATFLCLTSLYEGWGMVLTEAMAYECVPIAFDSYESIRDVIPDEDLIITPFDTGKMAKRLEQLAENSDLLDKKKKRNLTHIEKFEASKIASEWIRNLESLIST